MRSAVATDEPPYFCTTSATGNHSFGATTTNLNYPSRDRPRGRQAIPKSGRGRDTPQPCTTGSARGGANVSVRRRLLPRSGPAAALLALAVTAGCSGAPDPQPTPSPSA